MNNRVAVWFPPILERLKSKEGVAVPDRKKDSPQTENEEGDEEHYYALRKARDEATHEGNNAGRGQHVLSPGGVGHATQPVTAECRAWSRERR